MITVKPYAGLANRLRVLDSVVGLHGNDSKKLKLIWNRNKECNCRFTDLFEIPDFIDLKETKSYVQDGGRYNKYRRNLFNTMGLDFPVGYSKVVSDREIVPAKEAGNDFMALTSGKNVFINSMTRFFIPQNPYYYLKPVQSVLDIVDKMTANFNKHTIGIHIRRSDNAESIQNSPTEAFINKMRDALILHPETNFFLATDAVDEEANLRETFGEKIITYEKISLDRNKPEAIKDALIDMLCLSRTSKIIGSFYSSFSEAAAEIGGIELELAVSK